MDFKENCNSSTVKHVWNSHFQEDRKLIFKTNYRLKPVKSISGEHSSILSTYAGLRSAVDNVSVYRCVSDCRSRGREFDPGPVPYFRGDWSWNDFYSHSPPFRWFIQEGLLSVTSESMCTNYWLTACSSLPRKKCGLVTWPSRNDHSCWLWT